MEQQPPDLLRDRVVAALGDQYELECEIGRGGMSVVYRARDRRLNRVVAIKVLPPELGYDPAVRLRFTREGQTSAQLAHAHIVPIYDVGERDGIAWLVMAHVTGGNLAALLAREPRQPIHEVRRILSEIADALAYAHARGVIHRDMKPDNILLDRESGRAMLTDFGIARAMETNTRLTQTGVAVGTPTYMSPEQAMGDREVDGRSDLYSLGVVGYQMLTGRLPFVAGNSMALLLKHVAERPPAVAELRPDAPKGLRDAIERALAKSPEDRWPHATALREALAADAPAGAPWRAGEREPVRYASPRPDGPRAERALASGATARSRGAEPAREREEAKARPVVLVQEHLATLTPEQVADLRLWNGRVTLMERIKAMRWYGWWTLALVAATPISVVAGAEEQIPPLLFTPLLTAWTAWRFWKRRASLKAHGLRLRRVLLMPRARMVIPKPPVPVVTPGPNAKLVEKQLAKLAPRDVLAGPLGPALRRAVEERVAIDAIVGSLSKQDRAMIPDVAPTANALLERVGHVAQTLAKLDAGVDPRLAVELESRLALAAGDDSPEGERGLALLRRQKETLDEIVQRRATLVRQLESASLALGNLRLDLVKLRSSGLQAAMGDVSSATREARALSREIGQMLEAVSEVKAL